MSEHLNRYVSTAHHSTDKKFGACTAHLDERTIETTHSVSSRSPGSLSAAAQAATETSERVSVSGEFQAPPSQHRGLGLQDGLGAGVAVRPHRVL